jgi:hypothetical protein
VPKGPPSESKRSRGATAARAILEATRGEHEINGLMDAGMLGLNLAELVRYFYPYRKYITGKRGLVTAPRSKIPKGTYTLHSHDFEQEAEESYSDLLRDRVAPGGARLSLGHARLRVEAPLAPLSAVAVEMLEFMETLSVLGHHVTRLRRIFGSNPTAMNKRLITMRSPRQMLCGCVLLDVIEKNKTRKAENQIELPTSGELRALAGLLGLEEYNPSELSHAKEALRVKAWDELRRDVLRGVVPFLQRVLTSPYDDPADPA